MTSEPRHRIQPADMFTCKMCGDCCHGYGGTYVTPEDISAIADFISVTPDVFIETYCRESGEKLLLSQRSDGYCIFWDAACTIHSVKPRMCRAWPFIEAVMKDYANWHIMANSCPGICKDIPEEILIPYIKKSLSELDNKK